MSTDSTSNESPSHESTSTEPGPSILTERTLLGIFVHFIAILPFLGFVTAGIIYAVSEHEFTRANARNALNWQLLVSGSFLAVFVLVFGVGTLFEYVALPGVIETVVFVPVFALATVTILLGFLNFFVWIVATAKAIFGDAWRYPFAPEFV